MIAMEENWAAECLPRFIEDGGETFLAFVSDWMLNEATEK